MTKSNGVMSGGLTCQGIGSVHPIHHSCSRSSRNYDTTRRYCGGDVL